MKRNTVFLLTAGALFSLASCTKVIDVNLNDADPKVVIEARVSDQAGPQRVKLSKTVNFNTDNVFPPVSGATVIIRDITAGLADTLNETTPGTYETGSIPGVEGHTYTLEINAEGKTYTSTSTMPNAVPFDSLYSEDFAFFGDILKTMVPVFQDPPGVKNFYRFILKVNGKYKQEYSWDDRFSDGRRNDGPLFDEGSNDDDEDEDEKIKAGDNAEVEMQCVDEAAFRYFDSFYQASGNADAPANPVTNIQGGALGYFSAYTSRIRTTIVK